MRKCIVTERYGKGRNSYTEEHKGWYYGLCHISEIITPSIVNGGHSGGQIEDTFAIVEMESDHSLKKVKIEKIRFLDSPENNFDCEYYERRSEPNLGLKDSGIWKKGIFKGWSTDYEEFESGPAIYPAAIIEDEYGNIHSKYVELVRFIK